MNTVVCVLKSGRFKPWTAKDYTVEYGPHHVRWLRDQFKARVSAPHQFVCMTDMDVGGVDTMPLQDDLPGWWSKLEIFREFRRALYVDLDTVIVGDISPYVFEGHRFTMSANLTRKYGYNSSIMSWNGDYSRIYYQFIADPKRFMREYTTPHCWGDQDFIRDAMRGIGPILKFQDLTPALVLSYKRDFTDGANVTGVRRRLRVRLRADWKERPRVVCFHGKPKPADVQDVHDWIPKLCVG